jgi:hypothetical protein
MMREDYRSDGLLVRRHCWRIGLVRVNVAKVTNIQVPPHAATVANMGTTYPTNRDSFNLCVEQLMSARNVIQGRRRVQMHLLRAKPRRERGKEMSGSFGWWVVKYARGGEVWIAEVEPRR